MAGGNTLVYFLEEDVVAALLPGWPAEMQVAVCLSSEGECDLAIHHRSEEARIPARVAALVGRCRQDLCVVPQIDGYETRKVLFSQEQQLLSLVADSPHLTEMACDYAINFRFAREQGIDVAPSEGAREGLKTKVPADQHVPPPPCVGEQNGEARQSMAKAHLQGHEQPAHVTRGAPARTPRRLFKPVHATVAALFALVLVSGHFATARDNNPQLTTAEATPDGADAVLGLIAVMALADTAQWMPAPGP